MSDFTFNGISASSMGLVVESRPPQHIPKKHIVRHKISGRSGDLTEWDGSWENFTQSYSCWFKSSPVSVQAHKIKSWLSTAPVGAKLEDTYDDTVYHHATYIGGADIENIHDRFGRFTISFDCTPRAWLKSGDTPVTITDSDFVQNPTDFPAHPLIEFTGHVSGSITVGGKKMTIMFPDDADHTVRVDCALGEAWELVDGAEIPTNTVILSRDFPVLMPGRNTISITGGIASVRMWPRWWKL